MANTGRKKERERITNNSQITYKKSQTREKLVNPEKETKERRKTVKEYLHTDSRVIYMFVDLIEK